MNKSNPVLFEWLKSPIMYYKDNYFYNIMQELSKEYFSKISSVYHYLHMANKNYRQYLQTEEVKIKKYFYVLRPVLACLWIENKNEPPPMKFETLLTQITEKELLDKINELLIKKKSGKELGMEPRIEIINDFIGQNIKRLEGNISGFNPREKPKQDILEEKFIKILDYVEEKYPFVVHSRR
jgi:predicted nucleotidyltransferase